MWLKKINWILVGIMVSGLILRLATVTAAVHGDLITQAGWGDWIYHHGWFGFYENKTWIYGWPNHPPLINLVYGLGFKLHEWLNTIFVGIGTFIAMHRLGASKILWFYDFIYWFGNAFYSDTPYRWGELISMKLIVIAADMGLAGMIFRIVKNRAKEKAAIIITSIYLFSPFSWYESSVWGQNDQLGLIFLLAAFWLVCKDKWAWLASVILAVSIGLKPTAFIFGPLFLWFALKSKRRFWSVIVGGLLTLVLYFGLTKVTSPFNFIDFNINLQKQMFVKGEMWTWVNTFNFWRIISAYLTNYLDKFLGLSYKTWGYILFFGFNFWTFWKNRERDWWSALRSIFVVSFSGWLFMVTMHERYLFAAVVSGLILTAENIKMLKYWILLSGVFLVNMYNGWWEPKGFEWLKNILTWKDFFDGPIPRLLSLVNLILFAKMIRGLKGSGSKSVE